MTKKQETGTATETTAEQKPARKPFTLPQGAVGGGEVAFVRETRTSTEGKTFTTFKSTIDVSPMDKYTELSIEFGDKDYQTKDGRVIRYGRVIRWPKKGGL